MDCLRAPVFWQVFDLTITQGPRHFFLRGLRWVEHVSIGAALPNDPQHFLQNKRKKKKRIARFFPPKKNTATLQPINRWTIYCTDLKVLQTPFIHCTEVKWGWSAGRWKWRKVYRSFVRRIQPGSCTIGPVISGFQTTHNQWRMRQFLKSHATYKVQTAISLTQILKPTVQHNFGVCILILNFNIS